MVKLPKNLTVAVGGGKVSLVRKHAHYDEELLNLTPKQSTEVGLSLVRASGDDLSDYSKGKLAIYYNPKGKQICYGDYTIAILTNAQTTALGIMLIKRGE